MDENKSTAPYGLLEYAGEDYDVICDYSSLEEGLSDLRNRFGISLDHTIPGRPAPSEGVNNCCFYAKDGDGGLVNITMHPENYIPPFGDFSLVMFKKGDTFFRADTLSKMVDEIFRLVGEKLAQEEELSFHLCLRREQICMVVIGEAYWQREEG